MTKADLARIDKLGLMVSQLLVEIAKLKGEVRKCIEEKEAPASWPKLPLFTARRRRKRKAK